VNLNLGVLVAYRWRLAHPALPGVTGGQLKAGMTHAEQLDAGRS
jgi:hypothetical protein